MKPQRTLSQQDNNISYFSTGIKIYGESHLHHSSSYYLEQVYLERIKREFLLFYAPYDLTQLVIFKQIQEEAFLSSSSQTIKFRRAKCSPSPPLFLPLFLLCAPHTHHSCDRDPNHYWHTAPSPLCGFPCTLARSATGPLPHFDPDLRGNVIQRGAEAQRRYCSRAVGPPLHIRLSSLAGPHAPARRLLL